MEKDIMENLLLSRHLKIDANKEKVFKIIPELKATDVFKHKHTHHCYDVWGHTMEALKRSKPDLQIRMALLLHDIGKPYSYQEDGDIRHFKGHSEKSAKMAEKILQRLGYTEKEVENICYFIKNHDTLIDISKINDTIFKQIKEIYFERE